MERRLWREASFDLTGKLFHINWLYVLLLCALAGVGYAALYSVGGGSAAPYAERHALRFAAGLVLMVGIALVDIRFIARLAWPAYAVALILLVAVAHVGHVGKGAQRWIELGGLRVAAIRVDEDRARAGTGFLVPPRDHGSGSAIRCFSCLRSRPWRCRPR